MSPEFVHQLCPFTKGVRQRMTHKTMFHAVLAVSVMIGMTTAAAYCNARYGYCLTVPATLFPQGESDNGDGQVFLSRDAHVSLTVWGAMDIPDAAYADQFRAAIRGWPATPGRPARVVTYKLFKPSFFVVSGVENGKVFYLRTISDAREGRYAAFLLTYPQGLDANKAITTLNASFRF